ncbi:PIN domain-containing protein [Marinitenerispora sediminis]|uniref:VapC toxin family PIN domain ribonuclease n=1 Tax=Marinitenerispora sediminis TaxID=1931232 RepID=A0A368TB78_9ACTN|nr:PIN domain-containing protein [Marinitenerispora sediminis]RCV56995.1 VapC toxin family PIN domain ribonuclease [Marinitenerispora sediminis]RCV60200.1 VapC toxin family PIN domain ribonuclease [Marinitenerispora sediminis]RCV62093.1 VapC toxin family PIN domain ribonuclease [Marinitenerispora sediminis]
MSDARQAVYDTSVVIDFESLDLGCFAGGQPLVSSISIADLAYGMEHQDPVVRMARSDRYYATLRLMTVLPFTEQTARFYGVCAQLVRQAGRNPRPRRLDLMIAATAAEHSLPLLTRNPKDFADLTSLIAVEAV